MVRLKAFNESNAVQIVRYISIPYGAIKSFIDIYRALSVVIISIPYGAIKR